MTRVTLIRGRLGCRDRVEPLRSAQLRLGRKLNEHSKADAAVDMIVDPHVGDLLRSSTTFHRDEARHSFYQSGPRPPIFDRRTGHWLITDPVHCIAILTTMPVIVPPTQAAKLQERTELDLGPFLSFDRRFPFSLVGEEHQLAHRGIAEYIASRRRHIRAWFEIGVAERFSTLSRPGRVEVMAEIIRPTILDFLSAFIGVDMHRVNVELASKLFDNSMRLKTRIEGIGQFIEIMRYLGAETGMDLDSSQLHLMALMTMFAKDSLTYTFGESLRWELLQAPGKPFTDMVFKKSPPVDGVPFTERSVVEPFHLGGVDFLPGQHLRMFMQSFQYFDDMMQTHRYFGAGAHVCPGRAISVEFWQRLTSTLNTFATTASIASYEVDDTTNIFLGPKVLALELRDSS
jgi:hypothetical protein